MKIEYQETTSDLLQRIDIHQKYGSRDIDQWMLELLRPAKGCRILDVGCGAGKQCLTYHRHLAGQAHIVGGDVSQDLLDQARHVVHDRRVAFACQGGHRGQVLERAGVGVDDCRSQIGSAQIDANDFVHGVW